MGHQLPGLSLVHTGRRLIKQQEDRIAGECPGHLQQSLMSIRNFSGQLSGSLSQSHKFEGCHGFLYDESLFFAYPSGPDKGGDHPGPGQPVATQHGILQDGHVIKKLDLLESSGQTDPVNRVGRTFGNIVTVEFDCSLAKRIYAGNEVKQRGFPGAVRPNKAADYTRLYGQTDFIDSDQTTESLCNIIYL